MMNGILSLIETASEKIEFPNLFNGSFSIGRVAFNIFGIDIYWYGIIIAIGVILGFTYALKSAKKFGLIADHVFDVAFVAIIFGFIGARAYYCIFIDNKINFFDLRHGGLAIYGGIIMAAVAAAVACVIRKVKLPALFDIGGLGLLIGQAIGRWGNFVNQEAYGEPTAGTLPWGMTGTSIIIDPQVVEMQNKLDAAGEGIYALVHPCFLYESLWCIIGFIALHIYSRKLRSFDGEIFLLYAMWYGLGRFFIEGLRTDSLMIGDFRVSQLVAAGSAVIALALFILGKIKLTKKNGYVIYCNTDDSKENLAAYEKQQMVIAEKEKAKKAIKLAKQEIAPSILADDDDYTDLSDADNDENDNDDNVAVNNANDTDEVSDSDE